MKQKIKTIVEPIMLGLILFDIILLIIITVFDLPVNIENNILYFDFVVCILILIDFFYHFIKSEDKKQYFKEHWFELIASIPLDFFLLRFFRFIKIFRLSKLIKIFALFKTDTYLLKEYLEHTSLLRLVVIISVVVVISSIILFIIDPSIDSIVDGFWFVIATVTSVGYGDIVPSSVVGKIIGLFLIVIGFVLAGIFIGAVSSLYQSKFSQNNEILDILKFKIRRFII